MGGGDHPDPLMNKLKETSTGQLKALGRQARYTVEGLRNVPESLLDAADMSGVTKLQRMFKIEFPLAFPHIMLGVNQCVVFALFMVIIGAFIGTEDLGQEIMQQLFSGGNIGSGLMLGLCVAFIGLAVDHLIQTWATKRRKLLGIDQILSISNRTILNSNLSEINK